MLKSSLEALLYINRFIFCYAMRYIFFRKFTKCHGCQEKDLTFLGALYVDSKMPQVLGEGMHFLL